MKKLLLIGILFPISLFSQLTSDSLFNVLEKIQYLHPDSALELAENFENAHSPLDKKEIIRLKEYCGNIAWHIGNLEESIDYYKNALSIAKKEKDTAFISRLQANIGYVYVDIFKKDSAHVYLHRSLDLAEKIKAPDQIAITSSYLSYLYQETGELEKALEIYRRIYDHAKTDPKRLASWSNNVALVYKMNNQPDSAIKYFKQALRLHKKENDLNRTAVTQLNLAVMTGVGGNNKKALEYIKKSEANFIKVENRFYLVSTLYTRSDIYFRTGEYQKSLKYAKKAFEHAKDIDNLAQQSKIFLRLAQIHNKLGNYQKAYKNQKLHTIYSDSLTKTENQKKVSELEAQYQNEKKEKEIALLHKKQELKEVEIEKKEAEVKQANIQKIAFGSGLVLVLIFSVLIYRNLKQKQKLNKTLVRQKNIVEEKNTEIVDSINYAKRLQEAILPSRKSVKQWLKNSFILYKPKDIVAGDFYWMETIDQTVFFAAADCTGHGVPGAMVSVVCSNALSKTVIEEGITDPGKILDRTRELVIDRFGRSEEEIQDGMDIALCSLNTHTHTLNYSGAHNPLWIIRKGNPEVEEIKGNKQPIGRYATSDPFTTHKVKLKEGDSTYIFSDGFPDQFGGSKGKKYKSGNFKKFLLSIQDKDMADQKELINREFENWKGNLEQLDDVCVVGVRV